MKALIFYAPFGGGHLSCARAIEKAIQENRPGEFEVKIIDATGESGIFRDLSIKSYQLGVNHLNSWWAVFYYITSLPIFLQLTAWFLRINLTSRLTKIIEIEKPDVIVTTYFIGDVLDKICQKLDLKIKVKTLVADPFTFHPIWLVNKNQDVAVMSQTAFETALKLHYPRENLHLINPIVRQEFLEKHPETYIEQIRSELRLEKPKTTLIIGGGEGLKNSTKILAELIKSRVDTNIILVCGRDQKAEILGNTLKNKNPQSSILVYGFSDRVFDLMNIADVIVSKAGPGIIFEAAFLKKPIVLTSYLWGQELGNKDFVVENKLGFFEPNLKRIPFHIKNILETTFTAREIHENYQKLSLRSGNSQISDFILGSVQIDQELYF
jgi:processive 1,2-diacylglycerol beta-glucosyltransferase/1,2-diacylglycerol 3-beta-galactosyltransferase